MVVCFTCGLEVFFKTCVAMKFVDDDDDDDEKPESLPMEVLHCGNRHFRPFCSCDLDLDPMTFIYELNPYSV